MEDTVLIQLGMDDYLLRHWAPDDRISMAKYANNRKLWLNLRDEFPSPFLEEDAVAFIQHYQQDQGFYLAIANSTEAIGTIGIRFNDDIRRRSAALSYWLGEPFWGRGITTAAVQHLCDYVFNNFEIIRIYAKLFETNISSKRVLEKAGFVQEGYFRKSVIKEGKVLDQLLYAKVI